jgi:hypothetical protein
VANADPQVHAAVGHFDGDVVREFSTLDERLLDAAIRIFAFAHMA